MAGDVRRGIGKEPDDRFSHLFFVSEPARRDEGLVLLFQVGLLRHDLFCEARINEVPGRARLP